GECPASGPRYVVEGTRGPEMDGRAGRLGLHRQLGWPEAVTGARDRQADEGDSVPAPAAPVRVRPVLDGDHPQLHLAPLAAAPPQRDGDATEIAARLARRQQGRQRDGRVGRPERPSALPHPDVGDPPRMTPTHAIDVSTYPDAEHAGAIARRVGVAARVAVTAHDERA